MKINTQVKRKSSAQAMVEFAIALPVLLLLLYGLLETGRYLFLYSTVVNASRQAVRYGSATGLGNNGVPRYQDCLGIRNAAQAGAYVATFDSIAIEYDAGTTSTNPATRIDPHVYCSSGDTDTSLTSTILADNKHRIMVTITEPYIPLLPRLVPFVARDIVATSSRTILLSVSIHVTAASTLAPVQPTDTTVPTDTPSATVTASSTFTQTPSSTPITYTPTASFTPTITKTPTITFTPSNTATPSKTPTASYTPTASHTPIANCNLVSHGVETISPAGTTFTMTIDNPTGVPLKILDITVFWNHDAGHVNGSDKTLRLQSISLTSVFWAGNVYSTNYNTIPTNLYIPTGTSTITFTFHQSYQKTDSSERIFINLETNGCQDYSIDSDN